MDQVDQKEADNLTPADRQLLAREVAADRYGGSIYTKGDFKAGWDAALEWVRRNEQQRAKAALIQDAMDGRIK